MIRIFFNPLDAKSVKTYEVPTGTALIDFLQAHYPDGFQGALRVFVGGTELDLDDLDYEVKDLDQITMLVMPAGPEVIVGAIISAVVGAAVGYVISLIFPPKQPNSIRQTQTSPTYEIAATQNRFRLGEPIEVRYGTTSFPPSFAAAPYTYFQGSNDSQYVDQLLCLGQGDFTLDRIYIGETPLDTLQPGLVETYLYKPADHGQVIGTIAADVTARSADTENPFPFSENMFSSPEVQGIDLSISPSDVEGTPILFINGSAFAGEVEPPNTFVGRINGFPDTVSLGPGDVVTISGTTNNDGDVPIGSVIDNGDGTLTAFEQSVGFINDEVSFPGGASFTINTSTPEIIAGPFRAQKQGTTVDRIDVDITHPVGLQAILPNGSRAEKQIDYTIRIQEIDDDTGAAIGLPTDYARSVIANQAEPKRGTFQFPVTPGSYTVLVRRDTPYQTQNFDIERSVWAGLKGNVVNDTGTPVYGPVTMLAMRIRASSGISSIAQRQIRVTATRDLSPADSSNPITAIEDIFTNTDYGMGRTLAETETTQLDRLRTKWAAAGGPRFNGAFDQKGTGFEAMNIVASLAGAKVLQYNALTTVIADETQAVRAAVFSTGNIVKDSLEINYTFDTDTDYDGYEVEYRDAVFNPVSVIYPLTATNPEPVTLFGCTDQTYAEQFAVYLWNVRNKRRKVVTLETELEGLIPRFGDRIGIGHPMPNWGQSGVVVEIIDALNVRVDASLDWSGPRQVIFRNDKGQPHGPYTAAQGASTDIITLSGPPSETIYGPIGQEPSSYLFGDTNELIKDFMVTKITPRGEQAIQIEAQVYDEDIYVGAPPHMSS